MLLVTLLLAVGVFAAVVATRPPMPQSVPVAVAARDLLPGRPLTDRDVMTVQAEPGTVPDGAYAPADAPIGRLLAAPARRGEPLTDVAVLGPGLTGGLARGDVLATVVVRSLVPGLLQIGDVVSVVATDPRGEAGARVVAPEATVVWLPDPAAETGNVDPAGRAAGAAGLLVVAVPEAEALTLSGVSTSQVLDVLVPASAPR